MPEIKYLGPLDTKDVPSSIEYLGPLTPQDEERGFISRTIGRFLEPFVPAPPKVPITEEEARSLEEFPITFPEEIAARLPSQAPEILERTARGVGTILFPGFTLASTSVGEILRPTIERIVPETIPSAPPSVEGGFVQEEGEVPFPLRAVAQHGVELLGGGVGEVATRKLLRSVPPFLREAVESGAQKQAERVLREGQLPTTLLPETFITTEQGVSKAIPSGFERPGVTERFALATERASSAQREIDLLKEAGLPIPASLIREKQREISVLLGKQPRLDPSTSITREYNIPTLAEGSGDPTQTTISTLKNITETRHLKNSPSSVSATVLHDVPVPNDIARPGSFFAGLQDKARSMIFRLKAGSGIPTPDDVVKGSPAGEKIVDGTINAADRIRHLQAQRIEEYLRIIEPLSGEEREALKGIYFRFQNKPVEKFMEAVSEELPQARDAAASLSLRFSTSRDTFVELGLIKSEQRILNYLPFVRDKIQAGTKEIILIEGEAGKYFPKTLEESIPKRLRPFFTKERGRLPAPEKVPLEEILATYAKAEARAEVLHRNYLPTIRPLLENVPDELATYIQRYINYFVGRPGAKESLISPDVAATINKLQIARTIGLNPVTVLVQPTTMVNTFARSSAKNFSAAFGDILNPEIRGLARENGVVGSLTRFEFELSHRMASMNEPVLDRITRLSTGGIRVTDGFGRLHAFATGLREAADMGLAGEQAVQFAKTFTRKTQIVGAPEARSELFRTPVGKIFGTLKTFPIGQAIFMKDLVADAVLRRNPLPLVKFVVAMTAVAGSDAIIPGLDEVLTKKFLGEALKVPGFIPMLGVHLAHRIGIGGITPADLTRSFLFFLPGPAVSHVQDIISGLTGINMGNGAELKGIGEELTPDQRAGRLTRAIPLFGVQANRLRNYIKSLQAGGEVRAAQDLSEAFGLRPATGELMDDPTPTEQLANVLGLQTERQASEFESRQQIAELERERNRALQKADDFLAAGRADDAIRVIEDFEDRFGEILLPTPEGFFRGIQRQTLKPSERKILQAPTALKSRVLEEQEPKRSLFQFLREGARR